MISLPASGFGLQEISTSSRWLQLCWPHGSCGQAASEVSLPVHARLLNHIGFPVPWMNIPLGTTMPFVLSNTTSELLNLDIVEGYVLDPIFSSDSSSFLLLKIHLIFFDRIIWSSLMMTMMMIMMMMMIFLSKVHRRNGISAHQIWLKSDTVIFSVT